MARILLENELKEKLLKLKPEEIDILLMSKLFGSTFSMETKKMSDPIIPRNRKMVLKAGEYINKKDIVTTPGIFMYNKLLIEGKMDNIIPEGFYNPPVIDKKAHNNLLKYLFPAVKDGVMSIETLQKFLKDMEFWGLKPLTIFSPSFTKNVATSNPTIMKEKKKLLDEAKKKNNGKIPLKQMIDIEDHLIKRNKELIKDDPGMTLYDSGSRGSFDNDFKNCNIMVGPVLNPATNEYDLMESNYIDGIAKKDLAVAGNLVVNAGFPKAVGTQVGGYYTKQFYAAFQSIMVDKAGTDCGTKGYLVDILDKNTYNDFLYSYIIENGKTILLDESNINKYMGKVLKRRSPLFCISDKFCNKCMGERFNYFDLYNAGSTTVKIPNGLMNKNMKRFHVAKVVLDEVDPDKLLI